MATKKFKINDHTWIEIDEDGIIILYQNHQFSGKPADFVCLTERSLNKVFTKIKEELSESKLKNGGKQ